MKTDLIHALTNDFEAHAQQTESGVEFWLARDLQHLLGYSEWRNFNIVITKAKIACEVSGYPVLDHFVDVNKMVDLGSGSQREVDDLMLTRYACYLIAQNGDPKKQEIAFAQTDKAESFSPSAGRRFDRMYMIYRMGLSVSDYPIKHPAHHVNPVSKDFLGA
jgi:BRO family, N-terminal domain